MKQIFVTVEEFLKNGGILGPQREIYHDCGGLQSSNYILAGTYHSAHLLYKDAIHVILLTKSDRQPMPKTLNTNATFVQIYCQPIYL